MTSNEFLEQPGLVERVTGGNLMECGYCADLSLVMVTELLDREDGSITSEWKCTWCSKKNVEFRYLSEDGI